MGCCWAGACCPRCPGPTWPCGAPPRAPWGPPTRVIVTVAREIGSPVVDRTTVPVTVAFAGCALRAPVDGTLGTCCLAINGIQTTNANITRVNLLKELPPFSNTNGRFFDINQLPN